MSVAAAHCSFCCSWMAIATASSSLTGRSVVAACSISASTLLIEPIREVAVGHRQTHAVQRRSGHRPLEKLAADRRQHGVCEDGVDHTPAALDFGAPADDQLHGIVVVVERNLVMLDDAFRDPSELQPDDV